MRRFATVGWNKPEEGLVKTCGPSMHGVEVLPQLRSVGVFLIRNHEITAEGLKSLECVKLILKFICDGGYRSVSRCTEL